MSKLEELRPNASVQGILPNCLVSIVNAQWFGSEALELTYKAPPARSGTSYSTGTTNSASKSSKRAAPGASMGPVRFSD
jgi:hypothetical protein